MINVSGTTCDGSVPTTFILLQKQLGSTLLVKTHAAHLHVELAHAVDLKDARSWVRLTRASHDEGVIASIDPDASHRLCTLLHQMRYLFGVTGSRINQPHDLLKDSITHGGGSFPDGAMPEAQSRSRRHVEWWSTAGNQRQPPIEGPPRRSSSRLANVFQRVRSCGGRTHLEQEGVMKSERKRPGNRKRS
jgi:hypothetical protein